MDRAGLCQGAQRNPRNPLSEIHETHEIRETLEFRVQLHEIEEEELIFQLRP